MADKKAVNIRIEADLHDKVKHYCIDHGTTITELATRLFESIFEKKEEGGNDRGGDLD